MLLRQICTRQAPKVSQLPISRVRCYTRTEESSSPRTSFKPIAIGLSAGTLVLISYYALSTDFSTGDQPLSCQYFTPASIVSSEESGPSTKLITLSIPKSLIPENDKLKVLPVHSIYIKDDDIQIERPYTPLYGIEEDGRMVFWIKRYEGGEVGRWLHSKRVGDVIEVRGPVPTLDFSKEMENEWDDVVMISGGTGITPFFQLIHSALLDGRCSSESKSMPHFTLLHSSPSPEELPPPVILSTLRSLELSHSNDFTLKVFVDSPHPSSEIYHEASFKPLHIGRITKQSIAATLEELGIFGRTTSASSTTNSSILSWVNPFSYVSVSPRVPSTSSPPRPLRRALFLVCGPEPMINAIAGPRARDLTSGPVRGALGALGFTTSQVRKF